MRDEEDLYPEELWTRRRIYVSSLMREKAGKKERGGTGYNLEGGGWLGVQAYL